VKEWAEKWQLSLSIPKCTVFCYGKSNVVPKYKIGDQTLAIQSDVMDLGVLLSDNGKSSKHCLKVSKKGLQMVAIIFRNFRNRNQQFLLDMFHTYVLPSMSYNSSIWSPFLLKDIRRVERVLRTFTRKFPGLSTLSYPERLRELKLCSLEETRLKTDLVLTYKILHNLLPLSRGDFFELSQETRTRGHSLKLKIPRCQLDTTKSFFSNRVQKVWNSLPQAVVSSPSVPIFKSRLSNIDLSSFIKGLAAL
jgi:hypothetical protein